MYRYKIWAIFLATITSVSLGQLIQPEISKANVNQENLIASTISDFNEQEAESWTASAKYLAGIPLSEDTQITKLKSLQSQSNWQTHQNILNDSWSQLENQQLAKVREWSSSELASINGENLTLFYPFSGPDFLYAYSFFPEAEEYVLIGLEPIGWIPNFTEMSDAEIDQKLTEIRSSLHAILKWSFFRTNDMKVDMAQQGVLPYIMLFMARTNNQILDVEYVTVNDEGKIVKLESNQNTTPGVKISFLPEGESQVKTLYYFSADLSDGGLADNPAFVEYIKSLDNPVTYLKAASYLMYYDYFSQIRNLILEESQTILQDDSGMPVRYLNNGDWELSFYGTYTGPIPLFSNMYQSDLREIYQTNQNIQPLDFGVGYKFGVNESNLMLANKKDPQ